MWVKEKAVVNACCNTWAQLGSNSLKNFIFMVCAMVICNLVDRVTVTKFIFF